VEEISAKNTYGEESICPAKSGTHLEMPGMTKGEIGTEMKIPISTAAHRILATRLYPPNINKQNTGSYFSEERNVGKY